jgi:hypothetical protein
MDNNLLERINLLREWKGYMCNVTTTVQLLTLVFSYWIYCRERILINYVYICACEGMGRANGVRSARL